MTDAPPTTPVKSEKTTTGARLVAVAMIIVGLVGLYYHWHFTATWDTSGPNGDPNILGTGWVIEAVFWTLRSIPGPVLCGLSVILGALSLRGMAVSAKNPEPPSAA